MAAITPRTLAAIVLLRVARAKTSSAIASSKVSVEDSSCCLSSSTASDSLCKRHGVPHSPSSSRRTFVRSACDTVPKLGALRCPLCPSRVPACGIVSAESRETSATTMIDTSTQDLFEIVHAVHEPTTRHKKGKLQGPCKTGVDQT